MSESEPYTTALMWNSERQAPQPTITHLSIRRWVRRVAMPL
jgi:hypothetical protein